MHIAILSPVNTPMWNEGIMSYVNSIKAPDVELTLRNIPQGSPVIECECNIAVNAPYIVELAAQLEQEGADAIIDYCFADPALPACKEKVSIPVIGLREAGLALAGCLGDRIGVLAPDDLNIPMFARGLNPGKSILFRSFHIPILELGDQERVRKCADKTTKELKDAGCDVIVLGCGSMLGLDLSGLQKKYGIPVVFPVAPALALAEGLVRGGLQQSKRAFPLPPVRQTAAAGRAGQ